jgi:tRNA threonylcarbamoyladenosine biosynthesis protein TsaB
MEKCKELINHPSAIFVSEIYPRASALVGLAEKAYDDKEFENIAYFEPFYLKDFIATKSKKGLIV